MHVKKTGHKYLRWLTSLGLHKPVFSTFSVKRNPLQQFWLLMEPMSFGGTPETRRAEIRGRRLRLGEGFLGSGSEPLPTGGLEERCKLPQRGSGWRPDHKIYFGSTKRLDNASSGRKCRMQFDFFTEHRRSRGTFGLVEPWNPRLKTLT